MVKNKKVEEPEKKKFEEKHKTAKTNVKTEKTDSKLVPEVNIGLVGHVDHGKSTIVEAISGKWPAVHSEELKRGITIRLGYADATIYKCKKCGKLVNTNKCLKCMEECEPERTISFVDAPGHETLMATVLAGASLMDGAILIISADEKCPQPQTAEHLMVLDIVGIKNIIIIQNKIDLVDKEIALKHYKQIREFVKGTVAENAPIIPVSAQQKINVDKVLETIQEVIKTPERGEGDLRMLVVRSFDVNKPGTEIKKLKGGVLGGGIVRGKIKIGDEIEIRPGIRVKEKLRPIKTKVVGLHKAGKSLEEADSGGLCGVMTTLDPFFTKSDGLTGSVVGFSEKLPPVLEKILLEIHLLEKMLGKNIEPIKMGEPLLLNIGTTRTVGFVASPGKVTEIDLKLPICADKGERVAISRKMADRWRLIGYGILK